MRFSRTFVILIPSTSRLKVIYTLLLFQSMQVFCDDILTALKQTFRHNFMFVPRMRTILIWKISGNSELFRPIKYEGKDIQFGPEETYLIFAKKSNGQFTIYYWCGRNTSLTDKQVAAKYAVLLTQLSKTSPNYYHCVNMAREIEGMESDSFHFTIKMFNRQESRLKGNNIIIGYLKSQFPSPRPNFYVVHGRRTSRIKKIPISLGLLWLANDDSCQLLEIEHKVENMLPINYFCGTKANEMQIAKSDKFANIFKGHLGITRFNPHPKIDNNKSSAVFKQFLEILEDSKFYNPNEVDDSGDHLKNAAEFVISRDETLLLFDVTSGGLRANQTRPICSSIFLCDSMGYLLDTKSVAGIFLIFGDSENVGNRVKAIQLAEEYLNAMYPFISGQNLRMRIANTCPNSPLLDFEINLSDFPYFIHDRA